MIATGGDFDIRETYEAQDQALAGLWNDPQLDEYTLADGTPIDPPPTSDL